MDYWGGGGGAKGYVAPPLKLLGGAPPLPTPMYIEEHLMLYGNGTT